MKVLRNSSRSKIQRFVKSLKNLFSQFHQKEIVKTLDIMDINYIQSVLLIYKERIKKLRRVKKIYSSKAQEN